MLHPPLTIDFMDIPARFARRLKLKLLTRPLHRSGKLVSEAKKRRPDSSGRRLCWHYLSSRAVTRKVLSAQMSLTSVFGMGTGGPSSQSIPTLYDKSFRSYLLVRPVSRPVCQSASRSNRSAILSQELPLVNGFFFW